MGFFKDSHTITAFEKVLTALYHSPAKNANNKKTLYCGELCDIMYLQIKKEVYFYEMQQMRL